VALHLHSSYAPLWCGQPRLFLIHEEKEEEEEKKKKKRKRKHKVRHKGMEVRPELGQAFPKTFILSVLL